MTAVAPSTSMPNAPPNIGSVNSSHTGSSAHHSLIIGIVLGVLLPLLLVSIYLFLRRKRRRSSFAHVNESFASEKRISSEAVAVDVEKGIAPVIPTSRPRVIINTESLAQTVHRNPSGNSRRAIQPSAITPGSDLHAFGDTFSFRSSVTVDFDNPAPSEADSDAYYTNDPF
ncbi:hypothetical protein C8J56DRAFT_921355, partial [Mycena floridula]